MKSELEESGLDSPGIGEGIVGEPMARVPKMARGKISLARGFYCCPMFLYFFCPTSVSVM
jgi:hypothetical protein